MRLIRFEPQGRQKPAELLDGKRRDLWVYFQDWNSTFFAQTGLTRLSDLLQKQEAGHLPEVRESERWGAPVARPGKIVCGGLNFSDHAQESGMPVPTESVLFLMAANTVVGPFDDILIPRNRNKTGGTRPGHRPRSRLPQPNRRAAACIAGYWVSHDVSEREFQLERGGQWSKGESRDMFNPLGLWLITRDELQDVSKLQMQLTVNGQLRQNGSTETMISPPAQIVYHISQFMTLEPGDLVSTGRHSRDSARIP